VSARRAPLGVAVLGCGRIGTIHARNLAGRVPRARLVRVADADEVAARRLGEALDVAHAGEVEALLADPAVEAVVIATPPPSHPELIRRVARAGKAVFCEKPVSHDLGSAVAAVEAARAAGVQLQIGFQRRFDRDYAIAQRRIAAGELGEIRAFATAMRDEHAPPDAVLRRERLLFDATSHDFDCIRWLLGEVAALTAFGTRRTSPTYAEVGEYEHVVIVARCAGGALGTIETSRVAGYGFDCRTEIVGSAATLRIDRAHVDAVEQRTPGRAHRPLPRTFHDRFAGAYATELEEFVGAVRDGRGPSVDGEDGLAAMRLALAAQRSLEAGETVALELPVARR
jgi:predicted dehydrogenase